MTTCDQRRTPHGQTSARPDDRRASTSESTSPFGLPRAFWGIWAVTLVNRAATFVMPFLVLFLTSEKRFSLTEAGLIATTLGAGALVSSAAGGWLGDRLPRRTAAMAGFAASAVALTGLALAQTRPQVWVAALAVGLTADLARPALGAMIADVVPENRRVRAYSMNFWAINLGFSAATLSAGFLSRWGYATLFLIDAATTLAAGLVVWRLAPRTGRTRVGAEVPEEGMVRGLVRSPAALALVAAATTYAVVYQQAYSTLPIVMGRDGLEAAAYGAIIAVNGLIIVVLQPFAGRLLERFPQRRVYAVGLTVVGAGFALTVLASDVTGHLVALVVWSVGEVICAAVAAALFAAMAPPHLRAAYQALFSMTFAAGMAVGPALGTSVLAWAGEPALWWGALALLLAGRDSRGTLHSDRGVLMTENAYDHFAALHNPDRPLVLVNAWDAGSARTVVEAGCPAVATGSWSVAAAHGVADGEALDWGSVVANLRRIVAAVDVPVSLDLERGYGTTPEQVATTVTSARDAGAAGGNLEDASEDDGARRPVAEAAARVAAARSAVGESFWINARTDVFLQTPPTGHRAGLREALERGHAYAEAGASSLFVPGLADPDLVCAVVADQPLPVTMMAVDADAVAGFLGLGVVRVSMGPGPYLSAMTALRRLAQGALGG